MKPFMTRFAKNLLIALLALLAAMPFASGQSRVATFSRAEIDQMLAPVALYPDPLLSQLLMAATFPMEIVEAARWSRANPGVEGDAAVRMVQDYEWDPSVKSLVAFPQVLQRMDENLEWTQKLGEAFIVQEPVVMEAVQDLRRHAQQSGQLATDERQRVTVQPEAIAIEPVNPEYVYVPYYDPRVVYGSWWWPAYPPYYWAPWPGYARGYYPGYWWGAPIGLSVGFFFGGFDWHRRHAYVHRVDNYYVRPYAARYGSVTPGRWQHNYWRRDGGSYARRYDGVNRRQFQQSAPLRDSSQTGRDFRRDDRRGIAGPRVQEAPQQVAPRQSFAPRFDTAPRLDTTRQGFQGTPERRRDFDRAQRQVEPRIEQRQAQPRFEQRQAQPRFEQRHAQPRFEHRQQAAPAAAPRIERREQRIEQRVQRSDQRFERRADRHESRGGGRFN